MGKALTDSILRAIDEQAPACPKTIARLIADLATISPGVIAAIARAALIALEATARLHLPPPPPLPTSFIEDELRND